MTSWENTCLSDTNHTACPGNSCPPIVVWSFGLWTIWTRQQSQVPAGNNGLNERRSEGHAALSEVQCQPFFTCFYWAVKWMALLCQGGRSKRGWRILSQWGVYPAIRPVHDGGGLQRWQEQSPWPPWANTYKRSQVSVWRSLEIGVCEWKGF